MRHADRVGFLRRGHTCDASWVPSLTLGPSLWLVSGRMATQFVTCRRRLLTLDVGTQFDDRIDYFACAWSQESARVIVTPVVSGSRNGPFVSTQQEYDVVTPYVCFDFRERSLLWKIEVITSKRLTSTTSQSVFVNAARSARDERW